MTSLVSVDARDFFYLSILGGSRMSQIKVTFPDGAVKEFAAGVTTKEIAESISISLAKKAVAGKYNGKLVAYQAGLTEDGALEIITKDSDEGHFWIKLL